MTQIGYTMMCEQAGPNQLVRDVALAEQAGFDFAAPGTPAVVVRQSNNARPYVHSGRFEATRVGHRWVVGRSPGRTSPVS